MEIGIKVIPKQADRDGSRSYYKVVSLTGNRMEVIDLNMMGGAKPQDVAQDDFVTLDDWEKGVR